jgi:hypothetical protein
VSVKVYSGSDVAGGLLWCWDDVADRAWWERPNGCFEEASQFTPSTHPNKDRLILFTTRHGEDVAVEEGL